MNSVPISVIMSVYNKGDYFRQALECLINQTFVNYELICVNDASDDEYTNELLKEYQKKDDRITAVWLKENVGPGRAKNIGFSKAKGEYVIFLDGDDLFREDMLEKLYKKITEEKADICFCGIKYFYIKDNIKVVTDERYPYLYSECKNDEEAALRICVSTVDKLIKRNVLEDNDICFQAIRSHDDVFFSLMLCFKIVKQCVCNDLLIEYRKGVPNQLTSLTDCTNYFKALELVLKKIEKEHLLKKQIYISTIVFGISIILAEKNEILRKKYYEFIKKILSYDRNIEYNNKIYTYYHEYILNNDYNEKWLSTSLDYDRQLKIHTEELTGQFQKYKKIILWGNGNRGEAFQKFCKENKLNLFGVADIKNQSIGEKTLYGYAVVHTEDVFSKADMIVACNIQVFKYVDKMNENLPLINLGDYLKDIGYFYNKDERVL